MSRTLFVQALAAIALPLAAWSFGGEALAVPAPEAPVKYTTKTGVRVLAQVDKNSDTVAICLFIRAGVAEEDGVSGVGSLTSRSLFGSNYQQSGDAVSRSIYDAGGSLDSRFTPDYTLFTCVTNRQKFRDALYLLTTAAKSADFDAESLRRARADAAADIAKEQRDPFQAGYARIRGSLYAASPYRLPLAGTEDTLRRIQPDLVRRYFARRYTPETTVVSVVGNVSPEVVRQTAENLLVDYDRPTGRPPRVDPDSYGTAGRSERTLQTSTTLILAGYRAPSAAEPDYPAALVLEALMGGGKSSRLFRQIRDTAGVGYAVGTYMPVLARAGHIVAYVETDPARFGATADSAANPEKQLLDTVQALAADPPTPAEVERAKRYAAGTHALAHQRTRDRAFYLGLYETLGMGYAFDAELEKRIGAVTVEDVARVAKKCLVNPAVVVIGPFAK